MYYQVLGTPSEEVWEGVSDFPNYQTEKFGYYNPQRLSLVIPKLAHIPHAEKLAIQLLQVRYHSYRYHGYHVHVSLSIGASETWMFTILICADEINRIMLRLIKKTILSIIYTDEFVSWTNE